MFVTWPNVYYVDWFINYHFTGVEKFYLSYDFILKQIYMYIK